MNSMVEIRIDDREVQETLDRIARKAAGRSGLMRELAGIMHQAVEENFEKEGRPQWEKLRPATIRQRSKKGTWPGRILQARGRLAASIQEHADNDTAAVGTNVRYARIQQLGGAIRQAAREQVNHFRQVKRGSMTHGRPGTGDRFATPGKAHYAMKTQRKATSITLPSRPFLHLEDSDLRRIMEAAKQFLTNR